MRFVASNPAQAPKSFDFPQPASHEEILKAFDETAATVRSELPKFNDAAMNETWRLQAGERELFAVPRRGFIRDVMLSHWYQHRGQFSVYLRLLNVAVPASWGPSADEPPAVHAGRNRPQFVVHGSQIQGGHMCPTCVATAVVAGSLFTR